MIIYTMNQSPNGSVNYASPEQSPINNNPHSPSSGSTVKTIIKQGNQGSPQSPPSTVKKQYQTQEIIEQQRSKSAPGRIK